MAFGRPDKDVHMVRHDTPCVEGVAFAIEVLQSGFHELSDLFPGEMAFSVPLVQCRLDRSTPQVLQFFPNGDHLVQRAP